MQINQFGLFKTDRFLPIFLMQFFGAFNENVIKSALVIVISYSFTFKFGINSQMYTAYATALYMAPLFLFSALAGQLADRFSKPKLLSIIKLAEIGLACLTAIEFFWQTQFLLFIVFFLLGVEVTLLLPLKYSVLPELLSVDELLAGNGLMSVGTCAAILMSIVFGGVLILQPFGPEVLSLLIVSFAIFGWIASLFIPKIQPDNPELHVNFNIFKTTLKLIKYSAQHKKIFMCIVGISCFWFFLMVLIIILPNFIKNTLHANEDVVVTCFIILTIGVAIGALMCNALYKSQLRTTYCVWGAVGMALFLGDIYFAIGHTRSFNEIVNLFDFFRHDWRIMLDILLFGVSGGIYNVPLYAVMQHKSVSGHRARVLASNSIMNALFSVFAAGFCFFMSYFRIEVQYFFLVLALLAVGVAIYQWLFELA